MIRLKELRKEKNVSQTEVAQYLGVTQPAYANYERGDRQPDNEMLSQLAEYFNVTVDYILGISDSKKTHAEMAFYGEADDLSEEEERAVIDFIRFIKKQRKK